MSDIEQLVTRYLDTWNETDRERRRAEINSVWSDDALYIDPLAAAEGKDAIDATIAAVQAQFPGLRFRLAGPVDAHHDQARFQWELGDGLVVGFDVAVFADGRLTRVYGFLDRVPSGS